MKPLSRPALHVRLTNLFKGNKGEVNQETQIDHLSVHSGQIVVLVSNKSSLRTAFLEELVGLKDTSLIVTAKPFLYLPLTPSFDQSLSIMANFEEYYNAFDIAYVKEELGSFIRNWSDLNPGEPASKCSPGDIRTLCFLRVIAAPLVDLYLMDDPTGGVDPGATINLVKELVSLRNKDKALVIATSQRQVIAQADKLVILSGQIGLVDRRKNLGFIKTKIGEQLRGDRLYVEEELGFEVYLYEDPLLYESDLKLVGEKNLLESNWPARGEIIEALYEVLVTDGDKDEL